MNAKNLFIVGWLVTSVAAAFLILEYYTLMPVFFIGGIVFAAFVGLWRANRMKTRDLVCLLLFSIAIALIDEYAHTSSGVLIYFDGQIPSLLTVMGWGLFILLILSAAEYLNRTPILRNLDKKDLRVLPPLIVSVMIIILVIAQGYLGLFSSLLAAVYVALGLASIYYSNLKSLGWGISILVSSVVIGLVMELLGGIQGMWWYYYMEPMAWFMMFTWSIRVWAILACCSLLGVHMEEVL